MIVAGGVVLAISLTGGAAFRFWVRPMVERHVDGLFNWGWL